MCLSVVIAQPHINNVERGGGAIVYVEKTQTLPCMVQADKLLYQLQTFFQCTVSYGMGVFIVGVNGFITVSYASSQLQ